MTNFLIISTFSFVLVAIGDFLLLLMLSYAGTGFGFGDVRKDVAKILVVSVIIGLIDGAWFFVPGRHIPSHAITALVHMIVLVLFFLEDLSRQEAAIVVVAQRAIYMAALITVSAALVSYSYV